jgi:uncharacterized membrane protein YphA (DoxX/SURF4 family)
MITSLSTLLLFFAGAGIILTIFTYLAKKSKNIFWTFLQHFCGVWFIFSGAVKVVDPIGTQYKMEDYFVQFESTFAGLTNIFAKIAPIFPFLSKYSIGFAIVMIVLEIALGLMLIIGYSRKWTAWLFFIIVAFFTVLTGFTYLTGFVPQSDNFFDFAKWGPYVKTQMRVTDCGCFGDFLKLDPKVSFYKDIFLMIPALLFVIKHKWMHQLWGKTTRNITTWVTTIAATLFCFQNSFWDLPVVDFRPFAIGSHVRDRKAKEAQSRKNVEIIGWLMENKNTGEVKSVMNPDFKAVFAEYKKEDGWKVKEQIKTDPFLVEVAGYELLNSQTKEKVTVNTADTAAIFKQYPEAAGWQLKKELGNRIPYSETKISDFAIEDPKNGEVTEEILNEKGYSLMIVAYHLEGEKKTEIVVVQDTAWTIDTLLVKIPKITVAGKIIPAKDSVSLSRRMVSVTPRKIEKTTFSPSLDYEAIWKNKINPMAEAAEKAGWKVYGVVTYGDAESSEDFRHDVQAAYPFYRGDDKLLKTITRSNPGVVIWKDGQVVDMYHHRKIPTFEVLKSKLK